MRPRKAVSTSNHRARAIVAALAAALALVTVIGPATASTTPQRVTIVSDMLVSGTPPNEGSFTTSGRPLICESGVVVDTRLVWLKGTNGTEYVLTVDKTFTCNDGTLFFRLLVRGSGGVETFSWVIVGGTGRYAHTFGLGYGTTVPIKGGVTNTYTGYLVH
jgi:hypothetical protein